MKFFRETTMGKIVVLGRKNLETFPGCKPLPKRTNIIVTRNPEYKCEGAVVVNSIEAVLELGYPDEEIFVIGGEEIYRQMLKYCDECFVTKVKEYADADRFMVNLDESDEWTLAEVSEEVEDNGHILEFCRYERVK